MMCYLTRTLNSDQLFFLNSHSLYPWLSVCVIQDGHGVRVGNSMTYKSRAKHPGQVVHTHLGVHTLRDPGTRERWNISLSFNYNKSRSELQ